MDKESFISKLVEQRQRKKFWPVIYMSHSFGQSAAYSNNIENGVNLSSTTVFFYICAYLGVYLKDFFNTDTQNP